MAGDGVELTLANFPDVFVSFLDQFTPDQVINDAAGQRRILSKLLKRAKKQGYKGKTFTFPVILNVANRLKGVLPYHVETPTPIEGAVEGTALWRFLLASFLISDQEIVIANNGGGKAKMQLLKLKRELLMTSVRDGLDAMLFMLWATYVADPTKKDKQFLPINGLITDNGLAPEDSAVTTGIGVHAVEGIVPGSADQDLQGNWLNKHIAITTAQELPDAMADMIIDLDYQPLEDSEYGDKASANKFGDEYMLVCDTNTFKDYGKMSRARRDNKGKDLGDSVTTPLFSGQDLIWSPQITRADSTGQVDFLNLNHIFPMIAEERMFKVSKEKPFGQAASATYMDLWMTLVADSRRRLGRVYGHGRLKKQ